MTIHADSLVGHNHIVHNFSFASSALRTAATYATTDVGKEVMQTDTSPATFWRIVSVSAGVATFRQVAPSLKTINGFSIEGTGDIPIASTAAIDATVNLLKLADEFGTTRQKYYDALKKSAITKPKAAIVILLGQSLNVARGSVVQAASAPIAKMLVGGASMVNWSFFSNNNYHAAHWNSLSSSVDYLEQVGQCPGAGIINTLAGSSFSKIYLTSVAIGSTKLETLKVGGPAANLWAALQQQCIYARADGYDPQVMFYVAHGEANAANATTENDYYNLGVDYYGLARLYAAQAMRNPDYLAPIVFSLPAQQSNGTLGEDDRTIKKAIRRLIKDLPKTMCIGGVYQWPMNTDRIHPTDIGFVQRGEAVGRALRSYFDEGKLTRPLLITDVTLSGTTFVATFSSPVVRDASIGSGENLNTALAEDGFEWMDNGTQIGINTGSLVYSGYKVTGTLASAPVGTLAQQVLRIAEQTTTTTLTSGINNNAGSVVRSTEVSWPSVYDGTYTNYSWAMPQSYNAVRAA